MRLNFKSLIATTALTVGAFVSANAAPFTCDSATGVRVCTGTLQSPTTVISMTVANPDGRLSLYRRSNASTNTSTSIALAANSTAPSATIAPAAAASNVTSRTDTATGGQGVVYATITPAVGATEITTFTFVEQGTTKYINQ